MTDKEKQRGRKIKVKVLSPKFRRKVRGERNTEDIGRKEDRKFL